MNENFFVTAAHCIDGFNQSRMSVLAGTNDLREEAQGSRHLVDNCIIHPEYVELNNSDVAVCRVQTPFNFGDNIAPIALSKDYVEGNVTCILTGMTCERFFSITQQISLRLGLHVNDSRISASKPIAKSEFAHTNK